MQDRRLMPGRVFESCWQSRECGDSLSFVFPEVTYVDPQPLWFGVGLGVLPPAIKKRKGQSCIMRTSSGRWSHVNARRAKPIEQPT
jgi:hypothetical protein